VGLFFVQNIAVRLLLMLIAYVFLIIVDNATARLLVDQMLKQVFIVGMVFLVLNLIWIIVAGGWIT
jgi:ech hydrogenase subunit B